MESRYEYKTLVEFIHPEQPFGLQTVEEQRATISRGFRVVCDSLPEMIVKYHGDEGWEVNSHSISATGNLIVISLLIQRLRT